MHTQTHTSHAHTAYQRGAALRTMQTMKRASSHVCWQVNKKCVFGSCMSRAFAPFSCVCIHLAMCIQYNVYTIQCVYTWQRQKIEVLCKPQPEEPFLEENDCFLPLYRFAGRQWPDPHDRCPQTRRVGEQQHHDASPATGKPNTQLPGHQSRQVRAERMKAPIIVG